jgi:hypothetical protein
LLFGGLEQDGSTVLNDTWTWDGTSWTQHDVVGPSGRWSAAAASLDGTVVVFGGVRSNGAAGASESELGDTWTWDGVSWTRHDVVGPSARDSAAATELDGTPAEATERLLHRCEQGAARVDQRLPSS